MQMMPLDPSAAPKPEPGEHEPLHERHSHRAPKLSASAIEHTLGEIHAADPAIRSQTVSVYYGTKRALYDVSLDIGRNEVIALIGPSGCGKSTYLRCLNRMNDTIDGCRVTGDIFIDDQNIRDPGLDVVQLRARVGMVFQKPNPFPKSIYDNV